MYTSHLTSHIEQSSRTATYYYLPCIYACTICATYLARQATHLGLPKRKKKEKKKIGVSRWSIKLLLQMCCLLTTVSATITKKNVWEAKKTNKNIQTNERTNKQATRERNIEVVMLQSTVVNTANFFFFL